MSTIFSVRAKFHYHAKNILGLDWEFNTDFEVERLDIELIDLNRPIAILDHERYRRAMGYRRYAGVYDVLRSDVSKSTIPLYEIDPEEGIAVIRRIEGRDMIIKANLIYKCKYDEFVKEYSEKGLPVPVLFIAQAPLDY